MKLSNTSWKTALGGLIAVLGTVTPFVPTQYQPILVAIIGLGSAITGLSARDNNKTSEQVGAIAP